MRQDCRFFLGRIGLLLSFLEKACNKVISKINQRINQWTIPWVSNPKKERYVVCIQWVIALETWQITHQK